MSSSKAAGKAGMTTTKDMGTSPAAYVGAHLRRKHASPKSSSVSLLPGMSVSRWARLGLKEKGAWLKDCTRIMAKMQAEVDGEKRCNPFAVMAAAPAPRSMTFEEEELEVKEESTPGDDDDDAGPPSSNLRSRKRQATEVGMSVVRTEFRMWTRGSPSRS